MKKWIPLFAVFMLLAACAPATATPTLTVAPATATTILLATNTLKPTDIQTSTVFLTPLATLLPESSGILPDVAGLTGVAIDVSTLIQTPSNGVQAELSAAGFGPVYSGEYLCGWCLGIFLPSASLVAV